MMKMTKNKIEKIIDEVAESDRLRAASIAYMHKAGQRLEDKSNDNTDIIAEALGRLVADYDGRKFGLGQGWLCLEWLLDYYMVWTVQNQVLGSLAQIRGLLRSGRHTQNNKYEYFNDCEAFYVEHPKMKVCVFGKTWRNEFRYLVLEANNESSFNRLYVRKIWRRLKKNYSIEHPTLTTYKAMGFEPSYKDGGYPFYGDARDPGHVLTYNRFMLTHGKCDKTLWDLNSPLWFFFEVNTLLTQLTESYEHRKEAD